MCNHKNHVPCDMFFIDVLLKTTKHQERRSVFREKFKKIFSNFLVYGPF